MLSRQTILRTKSLVWFGLPEALTRVVLTEWLKLKHVVRMDSAFCCRELRVQFALLAYGQQMACALDRGANHILRWAIMRGARVDGVYICKSDVSSKEPLRPLQSFLVAHGSAIRRIRSFVFRGSVAHQEALLVVSRCCPNVAHFQYKCPQLSPLDISLQRLSEIVHTIAAQYNAF
jgi:hypothetical protein